MEPAPVPLARLIHVATSRWRIEEDHQLAKQTCGLDATRRRQLDGPSSSEHLGLVHLATTTPIPRPPLPPAMARLRRNNTMITTIYGCRI
ncbi:hypothetical protein [Microbispora sp. NPDC046933]|uniref:hypothetical protein n=1 Tax=Microbispora sp. NPDC046933 TaxID=3155618 RepID=UPI0033D510EC